MKYDPIRCDAMAESLEVGVPVSRSVGLRKEGMEDIDNAARLCYEQSAGTGWLLLVLHIGKEVDVEVLHIISLCMCSTAWVSSR